MSKKIAIFMMPILIFLIIIGITLYTYYAVKGVESKPIKQIEESTNIQEYKYMDRKVFVVEPKQGITSENTILYFHGGAYVGEITEEYWQFINKLVNDTGARIIVPDYPLVPKYSYKDVFEMVEPLYKQIISKTDTNKLIAIGDSAGGGLTLALEEKLSSQSIALPQKTILISPWLDVSMENEKIDEYQVNDKELNKETLTLAGIAYAKDTDVKNYLVSPIYGDLSKLKNLVIYTGTYDILNPDAHLLQEKALAINVNIELKEYEKAGHIWIIKQNENDELWKNSYSDFLYLVKNIT